MPHYTTYNDGMLLELLQSGNEHAFTELYRRYWQQVYAVGFRFSQSKELAEDSVQHVFMSLWDRRGDLNIQGSVMGYLATAVKYKILDQKIQEKRRTEILTETQTAFSAHAGADNSLDAKILAEYLDGVIERLPERTRIIYRFRKEEGLSVNDIATTMDISPKTVESHITKALKVIRLSLRDLRLWLFIFIAAVYCTFFY